MVSKRDMEACGVACLLMEGRWRAPALAAACEGAARGAGGGSEPGAALL